MDRRGGGRTYNLAMPHVAIVGAGLAGLATAYRLRRLVPGADITVLDAAPRPGGNVGTELDGGFRLELGPNGFLDSKPGMVELCRDLGLGDELVAASEGSRKNRYVYLNGAIHALPGSPWSFLTTKLLSARGKLALLAEPLRRRAGVSGEESVAQFARRRLGKEAAGVFMDALVTGVHAADWESLSVAAAFPRLVELERGHGSLYRGVTRSAKAKRKAAGGVRPPPTRMWSFPTGLQRLVDALVADLGPALRLHSPLSKLTRDGDRWRLELPGGVIHADAVILTQPAYSQAEVLADFDPELARELAAIEYNPIAVVGLGYKLADCPKPLDGFGYIAPPSAGRPVLGVQWCSEIFPGRAPAGHNLWRALVGGAKRPELAALPDAELVKLVADEMRHVMKVTAEPAWTRVVRWPRAIPFYRVGHLARVGRIEALAARHTGLVLGGNAFGGVALNDVAEQAKQNAARLAESPAPPTLSSVDLPPHPAE